MDRRAEKKLRRWLKMYFYNWCKAGGGPPCFCSFNGIYIVIFMLQLIKVLLISIMVSATGSCYECLEKIHIERPGTLRPYVTIRMPVEINIYELSGHSSSMSVPKVRRHLFPQLTHRKYVVLLF